MATNIIRHRMISFEPHVLTPYIDGGMTLKFLEVSNTMPTGENKLKGIAWECLLQEYTKFIAFESYFDKLVYTIRRT